jgi:FSR family fosmidomycin resistance protein-like MFS transporter
MNFMTLEIITVFFFSLTHCFVDLTSALVVYNSAIVHGLTQQEAVALIIMYDLIAFALQPIAGFLIDFVKGFRFALLTGIVLLLTAVVLVRINAISTGIAAGLGNALFHLGAGSQILGRYPGRSSIIGIFVGPGALGLSIGFWFGSRGFFPFQYLVTGITILIIVLAALPSLRSIPVQVNGILPKNDNRFLVVILL